VGATKAAWRAWARQARSRVDWPAASGRARAHLVELLGAQPPTVVLLYLAMAHEVDVEPLAVEPVLSHLRFAVARAEAVGRLTLHPLASPRERHALGFEQPVVGSAVVPDDQVGVVLVPALAFDRDGTRLGHGGGYYDRLLDRLGPRAARVGVGVDAVLLEAGALPRDAHDLPMDVLVTESGTTAPVA
jgi:5-formyltetrahydrofolate cyclo-ligase